MDDSERDLSPLAGSIWPPAPLRDEPHALFLRVEGMQLSQNGNGLTVLNISSRRVFAAQICLLIGSSVVSPWISFWTSPFHHHSLPLLLPYLSTSYRNNFMLYLIDFFALAWFGCLFTLLLNLCGVTLDKQSESIHDVGWRVRPISRIEAVQIKQMPGVLHTQFIVRLVWSIGSPIPRWKKALTNGQAKTCMLGALRQEANAEEVATVIAEFLGVPVHHRRSRDGV